MRLIADTLSRPTGNRGQAVTDEEIDVGFVEGRLTDEDGRLLVRATSSVMPVPAERVGI